MASVDNEKNIVLFLFKFSKIQMVKLKKSPASITSGSLSKRYSWEQGGRARTDFSLAWLEAA
jgi:hypothetical protein